MALNHVPECYQQLTPTRSQQIRFEDLANHQFTTYEKNFLVGELLKMHDYLPPTKITKRGVAKKSAQGFATRHNIGSTTIDRWKTNFTTGKGNQEGSGCPTVLDDIGKENICKRINEGNSTTCSLLACDLKAVVENEKLETMKRRGKRPAPEADITVSTSYCQKIRVDLDIKLRSPQDLTPARLKALQDIRMSYRIACMYEAFSGHLPATHKWNADATTMIVHKKGQGANVCYIPTRTESQKLDSSSVVNDLALLVKWVLMVNAAGYSSPIVLIVTVNQMPEDKYFVTKVPGLTEKFLFLQS